MLAFKDVRSLRGVCGGTVGISNLDVGPDGLILPVACVVVDIPAMLDFYSATQYQYLPSTGSLGLLTYSFADPPPSQPTTASAFPFEGSHSFLSPCKTFASEYQRLTHS